MPVARHSAMSKTLLFVGTGADTSGTIAPVMVDIPKTSEVFETSGSMSAVATTVIKSQTDITSVYAETYSRAPSAAIVATSAGTTADVNSESSPDPPASTITATAIASAASLAVLFLLCIICARRRSALGTHSMRMRPELIATMATAEADHKSSMEDELLSGAVGAGGVEYAEAGTGRRGSFVLARGHTVVETPQPDGARCSGYSGVVVAGDDARSIRAELVINSHASAESCWIALHGRVYDVSAFLAEHPGGRKVILREAGRDASAAYAAYHPPDLVAAVLPAHCCIGTLDTASPRVEPVDRHLSPASTSNTFAKPDVGSMLNAFDFEAVARSVLKPEAWAYYSSGSADEITLRENHAAFNRIALLPSVLVDVKNVDTSTSLLGSPSSLPVYITACALGKLGHPEGETVLTRAAASRGVIQMMPTLASCSLDEMLDARSEGQPSWFQLYVNSDREVTRRIVQHAEKRGCKGLFVTVDAPQLGRREKDMRVKYNDQLSDIQEQTSGQTNVTRTQGAARAISSFIDPSLNWRDIEWLGTITTLPIVLKGIQTGRDAVRAARIACVAGIVISNHGGRQLDTCRSAIEILPEVVAALKQHAAHRTPRLQIFIDGGIRRGSDVFKALALGADGVGIGRPALYAMSAYGVAGVERLLDVFQEELEMVMRLMGVTSIKEITEDCVEAKHLPSRVTFVKDSLSDRVYEPMDVPVLLQRNSKL
ncbi:hypothetical protein HDU84_007060 [Entophlyctis sp. JEL0112]|nr:hypothetical protein HDU84_007060 [Entophlyctis sp. JEL0112]